MLDIKRLMQLRKENGLTRKATAHLLGLEQSAYGKYELGKRQPPLEMLNRLAEIFGVTPNFLLGIPDPPRHKALRIRVLGRIPAGIPLEAIEDVLDIEEVPIEWAQGGREYFGLKIKGNSMSPKYVDGDTVLFLAAQDCDSGQDCAVIIDGDDATFKKVIKKTNGVVLQPINSDYEPMFFSNEEIEQLPVRVIGIAKQIRRDT